VDAGGSILEVAVRGVDLLGEDCVGLGAALVTARVCEGREMLEIFGL